MTALFGLGLLWAAPLARGQAIGEAIRIEGHVAVPLRDGVQRDGMHEAVMGFAQDGHDTIEWAARQTWAKGKVGMHGGAFKLAFVFGWGSVRMPIRIMNPQRCQLLARHPRRGAARGRAGPLLQPGRLVRSAAGWGD